MTTRRDFLERLGSGLVVMLAFRDASAMSATEQLATGATRDDLEAPADQIGAWLYIAPDGMVTVYTGKVEFGQGIRTSLAQQVAEELRVPLSTVTMVMGDTDLVPYDMGTFGSMSTPQMGTRLRTVSAAARELLVGLAAAQWNVDASALRAANGRVEDARDHRSLSYGQLVAGRKLTHTVPQHVSLTPPDQWRVAGRSAAIVGARALITGQHQYTSDMTLPGMLIGKVVRPPWYGATLTKFDGAAAARVPGAVVAREGDFAGVAAPNMSATIEALSRVDATWSMPTEARPDSRTVYEHIRTTGPKPGAQRGGEGRRAEPVVKGDVNRALASAAHRLGRRYTVAYIAHVPLEPRAALAQWMHDAGGDRLTVWTGTQRPFAVRDDLAEALGLDTSRVRVIVPDTGSGYGGKHTGECALEAARLARAARAPVRVVWTREEEFQWAYFRPAGVIDVDAGVTTKGRIVAWKFDNYNSGPAAIQPWYDIPNQRSTYHPSDAPLRQGSYRGLAATANHFARETHVNELATMLKLDPLAFRLRNIRDPRLRDVFTAAAARFGWHTRKPRAGHGFGMGGGCEKGGYFATFVEAAIERAGAASPGQVRVVRAVTAFDSGPVINPDGLRNQIVGAMIQGIGGALFESIEFDSGIVRTTHLSQYRVPRFADVPEIEVVLMARKQERPMGAGEAPIMGIAPAIGAAIHDITGTWIRAMPMAPDGIHVASR